MYLDEVEYRMIIVRYRISRFSYAFGHNTDCDLCISAMIFVMSLGFSRHVHHRFWDRSDRRSHFTESVHCGFAESFVPELRAISQSYGWVLVTRHLSTTPYNQTLPACFSHESSRVTIGHPLSASQRNFSFQHYHHTKLLILAFATMLRLFRSDFFNFEAMRLLSFTPHEGGEVAEFFEAAGKIKDNDTESWYAAWAEAGRKAEALATEAEHSGNRVAARRAFFRAANYQRAAQFMLSGRSGQDDRVLTDSENAISNHWRAASLLDSSIHRLEIDYEDGIKLPAYLYLPHASKRLPGKGPLLVNTVGADATQEEIFYIFPMAALELGYAVLTFEGPGQGIVLRRHNVPFRPDWEVVVSKVLDFAFEYVANHPDLEIDTDQTALAGSSMGGYLSLRGAADERVKACIAVDPFYSMWDLLKGRMPDAVIHTFEAGGFAPDALWDNFLSLLKWANAQTRWESDLTFWMLGVNTAADMFRRMMQFTFATADGTGFLVKVKCPVFVTGARYSLYSQPETSTDRIYQELVNVPDDKKVKWVGEYPGEGGLQSKVGAFGVLTQKAFAFLDTQFGIDRKIATPAT